MTTTPETFSAWTFHVERHAHGGDIRLVATHTTGVVVRGTWISDFSKRESPYITASALVPGTEGYVEAYLGDARHVLNTPLSPLAPAILVEE